MACRLPVSDEQEMRRLLQRELDARNLGVTEQGIV